MNKILTIDTQCYEDYNMDSNVPYWKPKGGYSYALALMDESYEWVAPLIANYYAKHYLHTSEVITNVVLTDYVDAVCRMSFGTADTYEEWERQEKAGGKLYMWEHNKLYLPVIDNPRHITEAIWTNPEQAKRIILQEKAA